MEQSNSPTVEASKPSAPLRLRHSPEIDKIAAALAKAQGAIEHAEKGSTNNHFGKPYANLASVLDACRKPLSENGLALVQMPTIEKDWVLKTMLVHSSGQWFESTVPILASRQDAQGYGGGLTYARRYGITALVGVAQDDDDGETAVGRGQNQGNQNQQKQQNQKRQEAPKSQQQTKPASDPKGPVKNEAPATADSLKKLAKLAESKNVTPDDMKEMMKGLYNVAESKGLKVYQVQELSSMIEKMSLAAIGQEIVSRQAEAHFKLEEQKNGSAASPK